MQFLSSSAQNGDYGKALKQGLEGGGLLLESPVKYSYIHGLRYFLGRKVSYGTITEDLF